jgi:haloacetate dehalogenase
VHGFGIDGGHHAAEENPAAEARAIVDFIA